MEINRRMGKLAISAHFKGSGRRKHIDYDNSAIWSGEKRPAAGTRCGQARLIGTRVGYGQTLTQPATRNRSLASTGSTVSIGRGSKTKIKGLMWNE